MRGGEQERTVGVCIVAGLVEHASERLNKHQIVVQDSAWLIRKESDYLEFTVGRAASLVVSTDQGHLASIDANSTRRRDSIAMLHSKKLGASQRLPTNKVD